jgi:hypothetical protein
VAGVVQLLLEGGEDLGADAHGVGHVAGGDRHHHEFLDVDRVVGVLAAVDDVHHRHRQGAGVDAAHVAVQWHAVRLGGRFRDGERDREDGVGPQAGLVGRAVQLDHEVVELDLVGRVHAAEGVEDFALDVVDGVQHALATEAQLVAVAQLHRLVGAGAGPRGDDGAAARAIIQHDLGLDGGIAAAVEHLAGDDVGDGGHGGLLDVLSRRG